MRVHALRMAALFAGLILSVAPARAVTITVPANPIWTDTGISLTPADTVVIGNAHGAWNWGQAPSDFGPAGDLRLSPSQGSWITGVQPGALIGFIGDVSPYRVGANDPGLFGIGAGTVTLNGKSGELWLGFNDDLYTGNYADNSGSVTVDIMLSAGAPVGNAVSPGVSISPSTLNFGSQQFGTRSAPQTVTVTNTGRAPLTLRSISLSDTRSFAITAGGSPGALAPGASRAISVVFTPLNVSPVSATLSINDDAPGSPQTVQLTGNGANPPPPPQASVPANLDFGSVELGASATRTVTVTNIGPVPVQIYPLPFIDGSHSADFQVPRLTDFITIPAGGSYDVPVTFTPTSLGPETATLHVQTDANPFPFQVLMAGIGVPAPQMVMGVAQPVATSQPPGVHFFNESPPPPNSTDFTAVRGAGPNGSLLLVDWAGTALVQLAPPFNAVPPPMASIVLDPASPAPPDGVGLARLLRAEVSPSGADGIIALRADNKLGVYRLLNGSLALLGQLPNPRADRLLNIDDKGQIAYVANVDPTNPASPLALYQAAPFGPGMELLRQGQAVVNGAGISTVAGDVAFSDLTGDGNGDLAVLVTLRGANGVLGQAVLRKLGAGGFVPIAVTAPIGQQVVEKGRGSGVTGLLTALRRPQIGPDGSVVFLGAGSDFVNFYVVRPNGVIEALLAAPGTDLSILDGSPEPGSSGHRFDYELAADGTAALQAALANPSDSMLVLVAPAGQVTPVAGGQRNLEPILPPVFGPQGRLFFLAEDRTQPTDRNGRYRISLYRYRPGGTAPEPVAKAGPNQIIPGAWPAGSQLLGISQRPVLLGNSLIFGVIFGGPQSFPVPTTALFQVPMDGTLAAGGVPVALEGHAVDGANHLDMLRDLSYQSSGILLAYGLMPGAGPVIAPPPRPANAAARFHTQALPPAPQIIPLVADGDSLGQGKLSNVLPPLTPLPPNRELFGARTSLAELVPPNWDHEGLFTSQKEPIAETTQPVPMLLGATFNGFSDTPLYMLGPPSVADDGRVVFKALLDQNQTPLAGIFQWRAGTQPTLLMPPADPRSLIGWAAGKSGATFILIKPQGGAGQLYVSNNGQTPVPVSPSGLSDLSGLALDSGGNVFVVGSGAAGFGVFQLVGSQSMPVAVALKGTTPVPPISNVLGSGYTFDGGYFELFPDASSRGRLIFRATISKGGDTRLAEFAFGAQGLITRQAGVVLSTGERSVTVSTLGSSPPSQNRNDVTVSAREEGGHWSIVLFRGNSPMQTIASGGQVLPNGTRIQVLDAGPLLQQESDPVFRNGPVYTIDDAGDVAFLASDGKVWGVYQVPAPPSVPIR